MTTQYHDNIAVGSPANASTFNNPLGDLDQAIVGLQSTINGLVIGSGTSQAEVIAARGGYAVLDGRFDDLYLVHNALLVDGNFAVTNTAARRFKTINLALAACSGGETILIAPGVYVENVGIAVNNLTMIGSGQPEWTGSGLSGGTIIQGYIELGTSVAVTLRDFGVDASAASGRNGVNTSANGNTYYVYANLTLWGSGGAGGAHGIYGLGAHNFFLNIKVIDWYHGVAIHGSYATINGLYCYRCVGTSLVIKAKNAINVEYVNVNNLQIEGDPSAGTTLLAASLDIQTTNSCIVRNVNISNVTANYCVIAALYIHQGDTTGTITDISVTNMNSANQKDSPLIGDFRFSYGSRIVLTNCRSTQRQAGCVGFVQASPADVALHSCYGDSSGAGDISGSYLISEMNGSLRGSITWLDRVFTSTYRNATMSGYVTPGAITVGVTAGVAICSLSNPNGVTASDYEGLLWVQARNGESTGAFSASYLLMVHKNFTGGTMSCVLVSSGGSTTGGAATVPSYTFALDSTNNKLTVTPVGSSNMNPSFSFVAIGSLKVSA